MKWLVVGAAGMLGQDVMARLVADGRDASGVTRAGLDVTDAQACLAALAGFDVVVNCAAWTAVDDAETAEGEAFAVNAVGAANLANAATHHQARLVQISTDYVFDGHAAGPYREDAPLAPVSAYGRTKAAGEWAVRAAGPAHHVLRTAWLYGQGGPNFATTIARLASERGAISVVDDQFGQPTWTVDVADLVVRLIDSRVAGGIYHATSRGRASWFEFAQAVVASAGLDPDMVSPTTSEAFVRPAPRPSNSVLSHGNLIACGIDPIGDWEGRWALASATVLDS